MKHLHLLACLLIFLLTSSFLFSQTTFTGANSTDWSDPGNWDNGLPNVGNDATIPIGLTASLDVDLSFNFNLTNNGTFENSMFLLNNSIIENLGTIDNTGTIINDGIIYNCEGTYNGSLPVFDPLEETICPEDEICDGIDNNLNGDTDEGCGCNDIAATNFDPIFTLNDGSCTYCTSGVDYESSINTPIGIGSGISGEHMAVADDCSIEVGLKAQMRFTGDIIPSGDTYRVETGESPVSGTDPTLDPGTAKWNYLLSVNLGTLTFEDVNVFLDLDFDPADGGGQTGPFTVNVSQTVIDAGLGATSIAQDSQNLGFGFWQAIGGSDVLPFDPNANGVYDLAVRVVSQTGTELANVPIRVETFTDGCTDLGAENYNANATDDDGSCTYCTSAVDYGAALSIPILVGDGISNENMAIADDCAIEAGIKAHLRFTGDIIPTGDTYRVESGESPTSGVDPTPAAGLAKWNYLISVNLGTLTFEDVNVFLDIDFDPAVGAGTGPFTADLSQFMIDSELGASSLIQDSQNLGFGFWQTLGSADILPFDPAANGVYDLTLRVMSPAGIELINVPIKVETFTEGCTDETACNFSENASDDDDSCIIPTQNCTACNATNDGLDLIDADEDGVCNADEIAGCTDLAAENYNENATDEDNTCTYCSSEIQYGATLPNEILIGSGISNSNMAVAADCPIVVGIKAHLRFTGDIIPTGDTYRVETGESTVSGSDTALDPGTAKWNYLVSVDLGDLTFEDVNVFVDIDFDPADTEIQTGPYSADISQFLIDQELGGISLFQDSQNLGFGFWQLVGSTDILPFDPSANGVYDLAVRVVSLAGVELANVPIRVETFTEGCTDIGAENYNANATDEDGTCTYCSSEVDYGASLSTPILIGSGISNQNMAIADDCSIEAGLKAHLRFTGDIVPTAETYRVETGESPISGGDATPDAGTAKWNYLVSVDLGTLTFNDVDVLLDIDFDPAVGAGTGPFTANLSEFMITEGLGGTSFLQDSQNLGFGFWQTLGSADILPFDPFANGIYDLTLRVVSPAGEELVNVPIKVETFTEGCTDPVACNYNELATDDDGTCVANSGCTYTDACNYDETATCDNGTCEYTSCETFGCTSPEACNYNSEATEDDGTCEYTSCAGCTYPGAPEYDAQATIDDGSCSETCDACLGDLNQDGLISVSDLSGFLSLFGTECPQ
ncbi:MAG: hypothetical protein AB8B53_02880 [Flavobacteriales bacterium]